MKIVKNVLVEKIEIIIYIIVLFLLTIIIILFKRIANFPEWVEIPVVLVVITSVIFILVDIDLNKLFDTILNDEQKKKIDFYLVRWKSKEFDEFIGEDLLDLYEDNRSLLQRYSNHHDGTVEEYSDYSFLVLPIAKVYEGTLKKILVDIGVLKESDLTKNPSINVGKYYNPVGNNKIFELLKDRSRDKSVPHVIYSTYQECRNQIFHYDQYRDNRLDSYDDAKFYCKRILYAIEKAYETFKK